MRRIVTAWLYDVTQELQTNRLVHSLAVTILDKILSKYKISKEEYQLYASASLLLATKLKNKSKDLVSSQTICKYTENYINIPQLLNAEFTILKKLDWKIGFILPEEFCDYFINFLLNQQGCYFASLSGNNGKPVRVTLSKEAKLITKEVQKVISAVAQEYEIWTKFKFHIIAASCVLATIQQYTFIYGQENSKIDYPTCLESLKNLMFPKNLPKLQDCLSKIEAVIEAYQMKVENPVLNVISDKKRPVNVLQDLTNFPKNPARSSNPQNSSLLAIVNDSALGDSMNVSQESILSQTESLNLNQVDQEIKNSRSDDSLVFMSKTCKRKFESGDYSDRLEDAHLAKRISPSISQNSDSGNYEVEA